MRVCGPTFRRTQRSGHAQLVNSHHHERDTLPCVPNNVLVFGIIEICATVCHIGVFGRMATNEACSVEQKKEASGLIGSSSNLIVTPCGQHFLAFDCITKLLQLQPF